MQYASRDMLIIVGIIHKGSLKYQISSLLKLIKAWRGCPIEAFKIDDADAASTHKQSGLCFDLAGEMNYK